MAYKNIKDQIVTILQGVSSLHVVYGKDEKALNGGGFPAACVFANDYQSAYQTVGSGGANKRAYSHFVKIYFRTDENNDPDYEDVLEQTADDVITALEHNVQLNGACDYALPVTGRWYFTENESPLRVFELIVISTIYAQR